MHLLYANQARQVFPGVQRQRLDSIRLAAAGIRADGLRIRGSKTPAPFVAACDKFVYIENLVRAQPGELGGYHGETVPASISC